MAIGTSESEMSPQPGLKITGMIPPSPKEPAKDAPRSRLCGCGPSLNQDRVHPSPSEIEHLCSPVGTHSMILSGSQRICSKVLRFSARLWPVNSMSSLPFKNSLICCPVRASAFCMRICIRPLHAYPQPPIFRIILCWKQPPLQDHLVLDNSVQHNDRQF